VQLLDWVLRGFHIIFHQEKENRVYLIEA